MRIAIIGAGNVGGGVAGAATAAGHDVVLSASTPAGARETAAKTGATAAASNADAVRGADLVVLAVKAEATVETGRELAAAIATTPVLCVGAELRFGPGGVRPTQEARSLAERLADELEAPVTAGLHSVAASNLAAEEPPDEDALVCGDDATAKELALEVARLACGRALDAGPLASARALEGMTAVIVNLNRRYRGHAGLRVTGLP